MTSAKASRKNGDYYHAISLIKQLFRIIQDFYLEHKLSSDEYLSELSGITLETANCFTCLEMDHEASCWINLHREITAIPLKMRTDDTLNNMIQTIKHRKEYMPAIHKYLGVPLDECDPWKDSSIIITREGYEAHLKVLSACRKKGDFLAYKAAKEKLALLIIEEDI